MEVCLFASANAIERWKFAGGSLWIWNIRIHEILISKLILLIIHIRAWQFCRSIDICKFQSFSQKAKPIYCIVILEQILFCINHVQNILSIINQFVNRLPNNATRKFPSLSLYFCFIYLSIIVSVIYTKVMESRNILNMEFKKYIKCHISRDTLLQNILIFCRVSKKLKYYMYLLKKKNEKNTIDDLYNKNIKFFA